MKIKNTKQYFNDKEKEYKDVDDFIIDQIENRANYYNYDRDSIIDSKLCETYQIMSRLIKKLVEKEVLNVEDLLNVIDKKLGQQVEIDYEEWI